MDDRDFETMTEHGDGHEDEDWPDPPGGEEVSAEEAAYYAHLASLCNAVYSTGGSDPYGTNCDNEQGPGHYPATPHEGYHPLAFGPDDHSRIQWRGGGSCAGDPLPYRDVVELTSEQVDRRDAEASWEAQTEYLNR